MEEQAAFNLVDNWFLGLSVEELPLDFSTLCRFRTRLGADGFEKLLNQVVGSKPEDAASLPTSSTSLTPPIVSPGWIYFA
jgi:hypothetical protein